MSTRTTTPKKATKKAAPAPVENYSAGVALSLLAIALGIGLWLLLWSGGFMASFVPFIMALLAVRFYQKGAGFISHNSALYLMILILTGTVLAFLSGMAADMLTYYLSEVQPQPTMSALLSGDFWNMFAVNIFTNGALWGSYMTDLLIAVAFAGFGIYSVMKDLLTGFFLPSQPAAKTVATN